jgi:hypothetical protein
MKQINDIKHHIKFKKKYESKHVNTYNEKNSRYFNNTTFLLWKKMFLRKIIVVTKKINKKTYFSKLKW